MFNLIPDTLKEKILKDYKQRRVVVWLFGIFVLSCTFFIFLLPTYVYVFFEEKSAQVDSEAVKNSTQFKKADQVAGTISEVNEELQALVRSGNPVNPIEVVKKVIEIKNPSIHIYDIEYTETKATTSTVVLKGVADKREALRQFVTKLEATNDFSEVILPVSNFAKEKDIDFTISITAL